MRTALWIGLACLLISPALAAADDTTPEELPAPQREQVESDKAASEEQQPARKKATSNAPASAHKKRADLAPATLGEDEFLLPSKRQAALHLDVPFQADIEISWDGCEKDRKPDDAHSYWLRDRGRYRHVILTALPANGRTAVTVTVYPFVEHVSKRDKQPEPVCYTVQIKPGDRKHLRIRFAKRDPYESRALDPKAGKVGTKHSASPRESDRATEAGSKEPDRLDLESFEEKTTETKTTETKTTETKTTETKTTETKTTETKTTETKTTETKTTETKTTETKTTETKTAETKSFATKSSETKSSETKSSKTKNAKTKNAKTGDQIDGSDGPSRAPEEFERAPDRPE